MVSSVPQVACTNSSHMCVIIRLFHLWNNDFVIIFPFILDYLRERERERAHNCILIHPKSQQLQMQN